ncbi:MAG: 6-carboxytetrahydropterin synthase [Planctomycetota bacterium]|nr:6-carboxytetrahydropterin synthase [Planctomycetota bacterium]
MLALTRRVTFSAGHIYRGGGLTRAELERTFGVAAEPSGHGHDYVLEVTVEGAVDDRDGMVVNIKDLDAALKDLLAPLDHRMLNEALPEFRDGVPTTERLAQALWARLPKALGAARATGLRLEEHPGLFVRLYGKDPQMVYLTRSIEFAASHRLHSAALSEEENRRVYGKCNNPHGHGHNYVAEVTVAGEPDPRTGIVVDLGRLEALLKEEIEERFDHKHLNLDTPYFKDRVASAENIARAIWELLEPKVPACREGGRARLHAVRLIETARSWFDYFGPQGPAR